MRYVTAALVTGGATGHRIKDQITARIAAHLWNLAYVHYPFPQDTWEVNGRLPNEPLWEPFLGFGNNEIKFHELDLSNLKIVKIDKTEWCGLDLNYVDNIIKSNPEDNTLFIFTESARILLEQIDEASRNSVISLLRKKYWEARKADPLPSYFNKNHLNVAMHVRRGADVAPDGRAPWRATADSYYLNMIQNIRNTLPQFEIDFHIYSEGPPEIFKEYKNIPGVFLHFCPWPPLNYQDLFRSFHHMITADILVTATSEFSYFVAHMNPNLTITLPVQRVVELPISPRHLKSSIDGSFDSIALQNHFAVHPSHQKIYKAPLYIYEKDAETPNIDKALQWAYSADLEPFIITDESQIKHSKFLQLINPDYRIPDIAQVADFHLTHDFVDIFDTQGVCIAKNKANKNNFYFSFK